MKKVLCLVSFVLVLLNLYQVTYGYSENEKLAADFLSYKDIIVVQENGDDYKLDSNITRREMAKVTINLSGISFINQCNQDFDDVITGDWGCKYAEAGLKKGFFANNTMFNPNNSISKIEALKMIMKGTMLEKNTTSDWREGYVTAALDSGLLENSFSDYDTMATRGWIFLIAQRAIQYSDDIEMSILEELLNI